MSKMSKHKIVEVDVFFEIKKALRQANEKLLVVEKTCDQEWGDYLDRRSKTYKDLEMELCHANGMLNAIQDACKQEIVDWNDMYEQFGGGASETQRGRAEFAERVTEIAWFLEHKSKRDANGDRLVDNEEGRGRGSCGLCGYLTLRCTCD